MSAMEGVEYQYPKKHKRLFKQAKPPTLYQNKPAPVKRKRVLKQGRGGLVTGMNNLNKWPKSFSNIH